MTQYGEELAAGTELEEFEIERTLGAGGFGITYGAWDRSLDRRVAIKEYLPRDWGSRRADGSVGPRSAGDARDYRWGLERFLAEARILAKVEHPNIVRVHRRIPAANGTAYMVMEYVDGRSLMQELAAEGTLSEMRVRGILAALMAGLEPVHASGLLHRDIKPANVMLRAKDGRPVLIDFGAARQVIGQQSRSVTSVLTPGYAPIELYETHGHQGPWTDIYALGALAYIALTGRLPDDATTRVRNDRLESVAGGEGQAVSAELAAAVAAALVVNESERPQSLEAWRELLAVPVGGRESTPILGKSAPVGEESRPLARESRPLAEESGPVPGEERTTLFEVPDEVPPDRAERPPAARWQLYGAAAAVATLALLLLLWTVMDRAGEEGTVAGGTGSGTATGSGGSLDAGPAGGAGGTEAGTGSGSATGSDRPDGGMPDEGEDVARTGEAALGLDREALRVIQEGLRADGFDPGRPDGIFGDGSRLALRMWQAKMGMDDTGFLDQAAVEVLSAAASEPTMPPPNPETETREETADDPVPTPREPDPPPREPAPAPREPDPPPREPAPAPREPDPPPREPAPAPDSDLLPDPLTVFRSCPDCPEMVVVPPGRFTMGSTQGQADELPVHEVRVGLFALGQHEVTRGEYQSFVTATNHAAAGCNVLDDKGDLDWNARASWRDPGFEQEDDHPVVCVSWDDAQAYVQWLIQRTAEPYRLPSEAEWEFAARSRTTTARYWGSGSADQCGHANGGDRTLMQRLGNWPLPAARCEDGAVRTTHVGAYEPNAFGLHDMMGNVWEWMADCWHENYRGAPTDGSAWGGENCGGRVWRGGSWDTAPIGLRSANRYRNDNRPNNLTGFRVARGSGSGGTGRR